MTENMKKLLELASSNEALRTRLNSASREDVIAIAGEQGIALTDTDFESKESGLSDDELTVVAGGKKCYCAMGGGGTGESSNHTTTCACVAFGCGRMESGKSRCGCNFVGTGGNDPVLP